jgi:hypothetical protein
VGKTFSAGIALPLGEVRSDLREPAEIVAAFVDCKHLAAHFDLVALPGAGFFKLARDAVLLVIADQSWLLAAQINLSVDGLVNFKALRQSLREGARWFGGEKMLSAATALRTGVQIVGLAIAAGMYDRHAVVAIFIDPDALVQSAFVGLN